MSNLKSAEELIRQLSPKLTEEDREKVLKFISAHPRLCFISNIKKEDLEVLTEQELTIRLQAGVDHVLNSAPAEQVFVFVEAMLELMSEHQSNKRDDKPGENEPNHTEDDAGC